MGVYCELFITTVFIVPEAKPGYNAVIISLGFTLTFTLTLDHSHSLSLSLSLALPLSPLFDGNHSRSELWTTCHKQLLWRI